MQLIIETAQAAAKLAGKKVLSQYKNFNRGSAQLKRYSEFVTIADKASEKIILSKIKKVFPDHHILSEESGADKKRSDYTWVVDPIDGTTNFTMHNPFWGISIGVAYKNEIIAGAVYAPLLDEMFWAEAGKGAFLNGKKIGVSHFSRGKTLNAFCNNRLTKHMERALKFFSIMKRAEEGCYQYGSASLELAYVAAGRLESMTVPGAYPWDVAAGAILVEEAGGRVTDFQGREWKLDSADMLATNGRVHKKLLKILEKI